MRAAAAIGAVRLLGTLVCAFAVLPAAAREISVTAPSIDRASPPATVSADDVTGPQASPPLTAEESALLGKALSVDPVTLASTASAPALHVPSLATPQSLDVKSTDNADGSGAVTVKQPLTSSEWDANVGADLNTAPPTTGYRPDRPYSGNADDTGAAWASVGVPNVASVDARLDPTNEQGKLGATLKHSMPIGNKMSVTVQSSYSVTQSYNQPSSATAVPDATASATQPSTQVWGSDKSVKLDIQSTGTTLAADIATASNDPVIHNTFSVDQKIFGPLHVTTAVSDLGQPVPNKSITAGLKLNW